MSDEKPALFRLELNAAHKSRDDLPDWSGDSYALAGGAPAREAQALPLVELHEGDVVELELQDGSHILVAAADVETYLGPAPARGGQAHEPGLIRVGNSLRLAGTAQSRDGFGAWLLKALHVYRRGPAAVAAVTLAGGFQDKQLENRLGLYQIGLAQWQLTKLDSLPASDQPNLLFIHGTASSCAGSFAALWGGEGCQVDARENLTKWYAGRVFGFEHRSLTESPLANSLDLINALPAGTRLHVVSHSRGGMVGEILARANRSGADPFTEADIQRFTDQARASGRSGYELDARRLQELNALMKARNIQVERFVRVAATARGTTLASGRLDRWASVMLNLLGRGLKLIPAAAGAVPIYDAFKSFLLQVVKERTDARSLPGLEAMMPDSPLVALLNAPDVQVQYPLHVVAGDYAGDSLLGRLGDWLSESFYGGATDLVVNTPSMSGGAARRAGIFLKSVSGSDVTHFSYFRRKESALPLLEALEGKSDSFVLLDAPSREILARGGNRKLEKANAPIVLMLPGIMGSQLARDGDTIWFNPLRMIRGEIDRLKVGDTASAVGWLDMAYEAFAGELGKTYEVWPFPYDWRQSIAAAADAFAATLDLAIAAAKARRQPLRIVAHSMGGLVARLALSRNDRWQALREIPGSRMVQFGTPNQGSHSMACVLMGRDDFVRKIVTWADWKHDMKEFLNIVRDYPGVLELLPWTGDGADFYDPALWSQWAAEDKSNAAARARDAEAFEPAPGIRSGWPAPQQSPLNEARKVVEQLKAAKLDPDLTLYVAGRNPTPVALRFQNGALEIAWTDQGDGRVAWKTGIPEGLKCWFVDAAHGSLLSHKAAFPQYLELLNSGTCSLPAQRPIARDGRDAVYLPAPMLPAGLYPSADDIIALALGADGPRREVAAELPPVAIELVHGSLSAATAPVMVGSFANDGVRGSGAFLDKHLQGLLGRALAAGRYPQQVGDATVFRQTEPKARPAGAIVVGLGTVGMLRPGDLTKALTQGLLEYGRTVAESARTADAAGLELCSVAVGTGFAGLSTAVAVRCLAEALRQAQQCLAGAYGSSLTVRKLTLFEDEESRVIAAAQAFIALAAESRYRQCLRFDGRIRSAAGAYRRYGPDLQGSGGWDRVHIVRNPEGGLRFTLVTDRARNEVNEEPNQRQAVDGLIYSATQSTSDQPGLSRALFELMVPRDFKKSVADIAGLVMSVDAEAATYPWELMRDQAEPFDAPLAARIGLVRQLASSHGQNRVATVMGRRVFLVGDTQSGFAALPGAQQEAKALEQKFRAKGYDALCLQSADAQSVLVNLLDGQYRAIHLAAHGTVSEDAGGLTGVILGPKTVLTTAQVSKLPRVPEVVFLNCCHLGNMDRDAKPRWGKLAANLATEFIEMGCKAVVAAGWAVDDAAADSFAQEFWQTLLDGKDFGTAVRRARMHTFQRHPGSNTWGAYQAYGDPGYVLTTERGREESGDADPLPVYLLKDHALAELEKLHARIGPNAGSEKDYYLRRLQRIEAAIRARFFGAAEVRELLGAIWAKLGDRQRAIEHYRAALAQENAAVSLKALEQLANLEIRRGAEAGFRKQDPAAADKMMDLGRARLETLLHLGETVERLSLMASYWKHKEMSLGRASPEAAQCLHKMLACYRSASELSLAREGDRDYYPTLNYLDGLIVLAAQGERTGFDAVTPELETWLAGARQNAQRRYAEDRTFYHDYAQVDARRIELLWQVVRAGVALGRDSPELTGLLEEHRAVFRVLGGANEQDSAIKQLNWLIERMPDGGDPAAAVRTTLEHWREMIAAESASG
ncbi:MAG: CHAT domain-containing protein [Rhodocyclaceae bacterium]|nr:CHAT domain-containing protein [Rhodocyclaceae bacterium]MBX3668456.1 CHAT domain-containing protein [Rhodocyclaceae bacterium]